jgi:transcriptional regulator NrdR family protein
VKCSVCAAWTTVKETRETDRGHTLRRTRDCANGHRFQTYEVLPPIYRNDAKRVRQVVHAAEARGLRFRRDKEIVRDVLSGAKNVDAAAKHGVTPTLVAFLKARALRQKGNP